MHKKSDQFESIDEVMTRSRSYLNFLRLICATLVIVSHAYPLGGFGTDPLIPTLKPSTSLGGLSVGIFFVLSGYLITGSAIQRDLFRFIVNRMRRIYPAYLTVLFMGLLLSLFYSANTLSTSTVFNWKIGGSLSYLFRNALFPYGLQFGIDELFISTPYGELVGASVVNGSLWTLPIEIRCYVICGFIVLLGKNLGIRLVMNVAYFAISTICVVGYFYRDITAYVLPGELPFEMFELLFVFMCGSMANVYSRAIGARSKFAAVAVLVFVTSFVQGGVIFRHIGIGSLALLIPLLLSSLPEIGDSKFRIDISYGTYLYAFPIQQMLTQTQLSKNLLSYTISSIICTYFLATLSYFLIERKFVNNKS